MPSSFSFSCFLFIFFFSYIPFCFKRYEFFFFFFGRPGKDNIRASLKEADSVTDGVSSLTIDDDVKMKTEPTAEHRPVSGVVECKCGMPLCICEAPAPSVDVLPVQV